MPTVVIPGTTASMDSTDFYFDAANVLRKNHAGTGGGLTWGLTSTLNYRVLIRLNTAFIPISSDYLALRLVGMRPAIGVGVNGGTVQSFRVLPANPWVEGATSSPASSGLCCWNALAADGFGGVTTPWAGNAGCDLVNVDYSGGDSASQAYAAYTSGPDIPFTLVLNPAWLPLWLVANNGIMVRADDETRFTAANICRLWSEDHASAPVWEVVSVVGGGPGAMIGPF